MKISIITPSFNQGQFIERTLQSVANQSVDEIEHIVIDGGSTDNTVEILKKSASIHYWVSEKDKGQAHAVNKGLIASSGEIIGWLNSDDIYYSEALSHVLNFFQQNPEIDVVYGMADHIDLKDQAFEAYPTQSWDFEQLKEICFICQPALFFRRKLVEKQGLLDESLSYCMDYEYWLRLALAGARFAYLEKKLAGSRLYAENKTLSARIKVHYEINKMLKAKLGRVPERWLYSYSYAIAENKAQRENRRIYFASCFLASLFWSAFRWNKGISMKIMKRLIGYR